MKILKQKNIPGLGAVVDSLYTSLPFLSIINFLSITAVLYATVKENLLSWVPWITLGWWLAFLSVVTITTMMLIYKFLLPSLWTFRGKQIFGYESKVLDELKALREEVEELKNKLNP